MHTDLVSTTASALLSLQRDRGRAMIRGEDWIDHLKNELLAALTRTCRIDDKVALDSIEEELARAEDPVGLLEELVLRHRLAVALYDTESIAAALATVP